MIAPYNPSHCLKCGAPATLFSPSQHPYCGAHGRCGHCGGTSWAWHVRDKIWVCRCYPHKQWLQERPEAVQASFDDALADVVHAK